MPWRFLRLLCVRSAENLNFSTARVPTAVRIRDGKSYPSNNLEATTNTGGSFHMAVDIEGKVKQIVIEQLDITEEEYAPEASFIDDLGADSLDVVELIMAMEDAFDIEISDEELSDIRTIQDVTDYIKKRLS
jgi:acyl carrier protein